jgi:hypothetical protein
MNEFIEKIKEDIAKAGENQLVRKCFKAAHDQTKVIAVLWYNLQTRELVYSTDPNAQHSDDNLRQDDTKEPWIRGRVFNFQGFKFLAFYGRNEFQATKLQIIDLKTELEYRLSGNPIDFVVDYDGYEIELS